MAGSSRKVALIAGVTGQDGAYLAEFLLSKGYVVHGVKRRSSSFNTERIDHLIHDPHEEGVSFHMHYGDVTDATNIIRIVQETQPDEIYNLAAQSHVQVSFETPEYTANADGLGTLRLLEAIRILGRETKTRFYQASTSELFGKVREIPQKETTPFYPRSPYAAAKLYAYWITVNYREAYGMHASNGILFNHESPIRGETFVTRKITRAVASIEHGLQQKLFLGDLNALRDWGHARDYVEGMWMMLQQAGLGCMDFGPSLTQAAEIMQAPVATSVSGKGAINECHPLAVGWGYGPAGTLTAQKAFAQVGKIIVWQGSGVEEKGIDKSTGRVLVEIDPRYFRLTEVDTLLGDASKAQAKLGWRHKTKFDTLVADMVEADMVAVVEERKRRNRQA